MNTGIYSITNTLTGHRYIGSARRFRYRWNRHKHELRRGLHGNQRLQRAWVKYGESAFAFEKILICDAPNLVTYEQQCFDAYAPEYNICRVAGSGLGTKRSELTRQRISAGRTGKGRAPHDEVWKKRISDAMKGRPKSAEARSNMSAREFSAEHRARLSAAGKGRIASAEAKAKMSAAKRGKKLTAEHIEKCANSHRGKKRSAEFSALISRVQKGRIKTPQECAAISAGHARRRERIAAEAGGVNGHE